MQRCWHSLLSQVGASSSRPERLRRRHADVGKGRTVYATSTKIPRSPCRRADSWTGPYKSSQSVGQNSAPAEGGNGQLEAHRTHDGMSNSTTPPQASSPRTQRGAATLSSMIHIIIAKRRSLRTMVNEGSGSSGHPCCVRLEPTAAHRWMLVS